MHTCSCFLPSRVASLLLSSPQLVSEAVAALSASRTAPYNKLLTQNNPPRFPPEDYVVSSVRFSRALYAQMTFFQSFRPPPSFQRTMDEIVSSKSSARIKALDIGNRLTVGLEVAYQYSLFSSTAGSNSSPSSSLLSLEANAPALHTVIDNALASLSSSRSSFGSIASLQEGASDDGWLYLPPDEFDAELNSYMAKLKTTLSSSTTISEPLPMEASAILPKASQQSVSEGNMDDIVQRVTAFLEEESDVAGVERRMEEVSLTPAVEERPVEEGLVLDMTRLMALLRSGEGLSAADEDNDEDEKAAMSEDEFFSEDEDEDEDDSDDNMEVMKDKAEEESVDLKRKAGEGLEGKDVAASLAESGRKVHYFTETDLGESGSLGASGESIDSDDERPFEGDAEDENDEEDFFSQYQVPLTLYFDCYSLYFNSLFYNRLATNGK